MCQVHGASLLLSPDLFKGQFWSSLVGNVNTGSFLKAGTILGEEALLGPDTGGCGRGFKAGLQPQLLLLPHLSEEL